MAPPKRKFKWRRWNNILHRDIGYLAVGLTVVYAISGVAVNHRADWNPSYTFETRVVELTEQILESDPGSPSFIQGIMDQLDREGEVRGSFRESLELVDIFVDDSVGKVDLENRTATVETVEGRTVLRESNFLHLNEPKKLWTWMADIYAVSLLLLATTGMFVLKGKNGLKRRGWYLVLIGILIPVAFLLLYF